MASQAPRGRKGKKKRIHGSYLGKKQYEKQLEEAGEYPRMTKRRAEELKRKKKKKKNGNDDDEYYYDED